MSPPKGQNEGQELGLECQAGVFPLPEHFAEMGGIPVNYNGGVQVESIHAVVPAIAVMREGDTLVVPKPDLLARSFPDARARERLHDKQPKLSVGQQRELCRMQATGEVYHQRFSRTVLRLKTNRLSHTQLASFPLAYDSGPPCILSLAMEPSAADRYPLGHDRPSGSEGRRAPYKQSLNSCLGQLSPYRARTGQR